MVLLGCCWGVAVEFLHTQLLIHIILTRAILKAKFRSLFLNLLFLNLWWLAEHTDRRKGLRFSLDFSTFTALFTEVSKSP